MHHVDSSSPSNPGAPLRALQPQGKASRAGFKTLMKRTTDIIFGNRVIDPA
jgi:hypothetical protein